LGKGEASQQDSDQAEIPHVERLLSEGLSESRRCRFSEALRAYSRVLEFDPHHLGAWISQIQMLVELAELEGAKNWLERCSETFPDALELQVLRVKVLARLGDTAAAFPFSDATMEADKEDPTVWVARTEALLAKDDKLVDYCVSKVETIAPDDGEIQWQLSRSFLHFEKFSRALKYSRRAVELEASHASHWWQRGECERRMGLRESAQQSYQHAIDLDPLCEAAVTGLSELRGLGPLSRFLGWIRN
jgi:tetratricopeptide (TPR) repeat protein